MKEEQLGVINEVGDLGLGFYPTSDEDQKTIKNNEKEEE